MPRWKGWAEHEVRDQSLPKMTGFTAINTLQPLSVSVGTTDNHRDDRKENATPQHTDIVSQYLGRGLQEEEAASSKSKTTKAGSKKRAATAPNQTAAKKRKTSHVTDGTPSAKPRAATKKSSSAKSKAKELNVNGTVLQQDHPSQPSKKTPKSSKVMRDPQLAETESTSVSAYVSVIAPATSMSTLQEKSVPTSFDAVRSSGPGAVLYSCSSSPAKQADMHFSQSPATALKATTEKANVSKRRMVPCSKAFSDALSEQTDDTNTALHVAAGKLEQQAVQQSGAERNRSARVTRSSKNKIQRPPTPVSRNHDINSEEDLLADDDFDIEDAIALSNASVTALRAEKMQALPKKLATATTTRERKNLPKQPYPIDAHDYTETIVITDDDEDEEMIEWEKAVVAAEKAGLQPRQRRLNTRSVDQHEDYGGVFLSKADKKLLDEIKSSSQGYAKPVLRTPFPIVVLDRSPIFGATSSATLRTCFRVGEALNVGSNAVRNNKDVILELYARVTSSHREERPGRKQHFTFKDLYHDRRPHLQGSFDLWNQSQLWDLDGKVFLMADQRKDGIMCRLIAKMKRDGSSWRLEVLSIWEAGWDDVETVAGIYARRVEDGSSMDE